MYISLSLYIYIYIYIHIGDQHAGRDESCRSFGSALGGGCMYINMCMYIYIYIYVYIHIYIYIYIGMLKTTLGARRAPGGARKQEGRIDIGIHTIISPTTLSGKPLLV